MFRGVDAAAVPIPQDRATLGHDYVCGIDWARHRDFTVLAVVDATTNELVHLDRFREIAYAVQVGRVQAVKDRFPTASLIAESNSMGEALIEQLEKIGLRVSRFTTTNESKRDAIEALSLAIERGDLKILPDHILLAELKAFQAERLSSGLLRYAAPHGVTDDCVMALAIAWRGTERRDRPVFDLPHPDAKVVDPAGYAMVMGYLRQEGIFRGPNEDSIVEGRGLRPN